MEETTEVVDYSGMFAFLSGVSGRALVRIKDAEAFQKSEGARAFLFIDSVDVISGKHTFPTAYRVDDVVVSSTIDEPLKRFVDALRKEREKCFETVGVIDMEIAQAEDYHANAG